MSTRARRATGQAVILPFAWQNTGPSAPPAAPPADPARDPASPVHLAALERDAFARGFAQGEVAGAEAAASRGEAMLRRLTQTLEEIAEMRAQIVRETEQQLVRLAIAIARRIVQREMTMDPDLLRAIARVAMDRLGETTGITVRLNPDDHAAIAAGRDPQWGGGHVTVVADARLPRGGCRLESEIGTVDASVDAQLQEITKSLLNDAAGVVHVRPR
jgi:flagellar assembly protein FliH